MPALEAAICSGDVVFVVLIIAIVERGTRWQYWVVGIVTFFLRTRERKGRRFGLWRSAQRDDMCGLCFGVDAVMVKMYRFVGRYSVGVL